ncbi:MAG: hypothetical protein LAT52_05795 [Balneolales bacterium]|nr:hypothetical protein [Balneolales bacterium]
MLFNRFLNVCALLLAAVLILPTYSIAQSTGSIPLTVDAVPGSPVTMGIPFPQGVLHSPDHIRILDNRGNEIPAQVTEVSTWEPADHSIKWVWVFFFAESGDAYQLEYGENVRRHAVYPNRVIIKNNQRETGGIEVDTGTLRFTVDKRNAGGFLDKIEVNPSGNGYSDEHLLAGSPLGRGSFLDMLDENGPDSSRAVIDQIFVEKGSGPLHAIIRIEGEYRFNRDDHPTSPFITRVHAYAGREYIRVYHTITYTGTPDQSEPLGDKQHPAVATRLGPMVDEAAREQDQGLTKPQDMIKATGLTFSPNFTPTLVRTGYFEGSWYAPGNERTYNGEIAGSGITSVFQTGPKPTGIPPVPNSTPDERINGFIGSISNSGSEAVSAERMAGWMHISDGQRGISMAIRNFVEEYPKEILFDADAGIFKGYLWSPQAGPMSFERASTRRDGDMVANFATGLTKTTELSFYFHQAGVREDQLSQAHALVLQVPVGNAPPSWYAASGAFGNMGPASERFATYERGLSHKFDWFLFNQNWEPWYGMFYFGDGKTNFYNDNWIMWGLNEPAQDGMWWYQFMRTGESKYYRAAQHMSRHSMDIGNIHWPVKPRFRGDTNLTVDWFEHEALPESSPYVGMGRRHGAQPWTSVLSAHVWTPGWVMAYYLDGYHRGLDVAKLTADHIVRRVWGEHDYRGRRLYLGIFNMAAVYDATKDPVYFEELSYRVELAMQIQATDGWSLNIDRYGYAQIYNSHGLMQFYQMTGDERVARALIRHAKRVRDVKPFDHDMESYLSSIHSLLVGYELSGERSLLDTAIRRSRYLQTDALSAPVTGDITQRAYAELLEQASNLPGFDEGRAHPFFGTRPIWSASNGLRVFGWTHAFNVPWLVYYLDKYDIDPETN